MVFIYILQLEQGKYYVGKTNNPEYRLENHFNSNGSAWTKLYKPIQVLKIIPDCDDYDEDKYTRIYMDKYGIDNVRGGSFVTVELDQSTVEHLKKMSNGTNDKCFKCGSSGHFANVCEFSSYLQEFDTVEKIDIEIANIIKLSHEMKSYSNNNKYIEVKQVSKLVPKLEINPKLYSNSLINKPEIITQINRIYSSSRRDNILFGVNGYSSNDVSTEFLKSKINIIYIERRKQEIKYCESLPPEYAEIFKNNNYENIYEIVKEKLLLKLEILYEKQADLISKI